MNRNDHEIEIDLLQLVRVLWAKAKYIVLITVIFAILGFVGSMLFLTPAYEASAKLIVNTQTGDPGNVSSDRLNSAKNLVDTYAIIIRDRDVVNRVITELGIAEDCEELVECISVKAVNNTQIMQIAVRHPDRAVAIAVVEKIQSLAPAFIVEAVGVGSVNPVGSAYCAEEPVSPSNLTNAILAAVIGFVLSCALFIILFLADNTYDSDAELQADLGLPVLGMIPKIESCNKGYGYSDMYGYDKSKKTRKEA